MTRRGDDGRRWQIRPRLPASDAMICDLRIQLGPRRMSEAHTPVPSHCQPILWGEHFSWQNWSQLISKGFHRIVFLDGGIKRMLGAHVRTLMLGAHSFFNVLEPTVETLYMIGESSEGILKI